MNDQDKNISIYSDIVNIMVTKQDVTDALAACDDVVKRLYFQKDTSAEAVFGGFPEHMRNAILSALHESHVSIQQIQEVKTWIHGLVEQIRKVQVIQVTLAIDSENAMRAQLLSYFRHIFSGQSIVIDLYKKEAIMGGIQVVYKGHYLDFSLKQQLHSFFEKKKDELQQKMAAS